MSVNNHINSELLDMVEYLKSIRVIKKDVDMAREMQVSAPVISNYMSGRVKASKKDGGLGIKGDFYSLKHSNLDETAAALDINAAAAMAGHTTPVITLKHYAHGEKERQHERLKKVANTFS